MVLNACRYFGHTRPYWWANLTWALYEELEWQLLENPPTDRLLASYFRSQKWWEPPKRTGCASVGDEDEDVGEEWDSPFAAVTD